MRALEPKPPFKVLIVSEQKSIGREMSETGYVIKQLAEAGVEIFEYVHGRSLTPKNYIDKVMSSLQGWPTKRTANRPVNVSTKRIPVWRAGHVDRRSRVWLPESGCDSTAMDRDGRLAPVARRTGDQS